MSAFSWNGQESFGCYVREVDEEVREIVHIYIQYKSNIRYYIRERGKDKKNKDEDKRTRSTFYIHILRPTFTLIIILINT